LQIEVKVDKKLLLNVPDILLQDIRNHKAIQGLLIGEQDALPTVNAEEVGVPITETIGVLSIGILQGRILEFLEEFGCAVDKSHQIFYTVKGTDGLVAVFSGLFLQ